MHVRPGEEIPLVIILANLATALVVGVITLLDRRET